MSTIESPLSRAHRHAGNADESYSQGLWVVAAEEHQRAADAFITCIDSSTDESAKRTLRRLSEEHLKHVRDLQRRIVKLRDEGKDPNLPQKQTSSSPRRLTSKSDMPTSGSGASATPIDESFMMLPGQKAELSSSFAQFWKILEGMLDQLSQPVAFATAPLPHSSPRMPTLDSLESGPVSADNNSETSHNGDIVDVEPSNVADWEIDSEESFCMIPDESSASSPATQTKAMADPTLIAKMQEESALLKHKLSNALNKIAELERVLKTRATYDLQLRDGILQAQKAITSSQVFTPPPLPSTSHAQQNDLTSSAWAKSTPSLQPNEPHLIARIAELEEKVRTLQVQDVTQKATIVKYKDRWDKVKESMRKKKLAKAAAETDMLTRENRIEEEAEPE